MKYSKRRGYMLLESIIYIFMTSIVFLTFLTFYVDFYKGYIEIRNGSIFANNLSNFYINLDTMIKDENVENVYTSDNRLYIIKNTDKGELISVINEYNNRIVVKYLRDNKVLTTASMLSDIEEMKIVEKDNLIYICIKENSYKEYIRCI